jgi:hypothetical protein
VLTLLALTGMTGGCGLVSNDGTGSGGAPTDAGSGGGPMALDRPACEPLSGENSGASSGAHTIRGTVLDAAGVPLVNVPIELSGDAAARHATSLLGTYTLRVDPGDYILSLGDTACVVDPNELDVTVDSANLTHDGVSTGGSCTTGEQEITNSSHKRVYIDDPNLSGEAEKDWGTGIWISESTSSEMAWESMKELAATGFEPDKTCSLVRGDFVGFESRWLVVHESDQFRITQRELVTWFVRGAFTIDIRTPRPEHATEEEMQRALVPVRNLSEEDLDALLQGL